MVNVYFFKKPHFLSQGSTSDILFCKEPWYFSFKFLHYLEYVFHCSEDFVIE